MRPPNPDRPTTNLVLPLDVKARLVREAARGGRTLAEEIEAALRAWWGGEREPGSNGRKGRRAA